jgi:hypothetical protein
MRISLLATLAVEWGPVAVWVSAFATFLAVLVAALVALGYFDGLRGPRIHVTFAHTEPWCRRGIDDQGAGGLWIRLGIENRGVGPARGCVGRLISVTTDGEVRSDVDPVQLRWAGLPRSRAFDPVDLRREQREYLNVLYLRDGDAWRLVTFEDPDFDPGFAVDLPLQGRHVLQISIFADNAATVTSTLVADATAGHSTVLKLL